MARGNRVAAWMPMFVALATFIPSVAPAQEAPAAPVTAAMGWNDYAARMDALEAELARMRTRLEEHQAATAFPSHDGGASCGCPSTGYGCAPPYAGGGMAPGDLGPPGSYGVLGVLAGAEAVWIQPFFEDESAFVIDRSHLDEIVPFDYDLEASPRFWLGYMTPSGVGARLRYWNFDNAFTTSAAATEQVEAFAFSGEAVLTRRLDGDPGDAIFARHGVDLQTLDAEVLQQLRLWDVLILGGAGLRYVQMEQDYLIRFTDPQGPQVEMLHTHGFDGVGPVGSLEMWRPLGSWGFSLYGATRASVLFGEVDQQIRESTGGQVFFERRDDVDEAIAIGEASLGLQWMTPWIYSTNFFLRGGWEGQYWHGAGNANSTDGSMGLQGASLSVGLIR
jgi:hypothetical protein